MQEVQGKETVRKEGRNLQNSVLTAKGKGNGWRPIKKAIEAEKAVKSSPATGYFPHFTNAIQKEAKVIYPSEN